MLSVPPDGDVARAASLTARVSHRLARHIPMAPVRLAPATPLVSFTFDDAPDCACTRGADLLADHGALGTYYIAGGLIGTQALHWQLADEATLAALHAAGHEIGSHTYTHAFLPDLTAKAIREESRRNRERLRAILPGLRLESFAYPFGFGSLGAKRALRTLYRSSRGILPGLNLGRGDRHFLRANPLIEGRVDADDIARMMDDALARNGWLIFYGHDVVERPSPYGCSPRLLDAALRAAGARGIPCATVAEGLRRAVAPAGVVASGSIVASREGATGRMLEAIR